MAAATAAAVFGAISYAGSAQAAPAWDRPAYAKVSRDLADGIDTPIVIRKQRWLRDLPDGRRMVQMIVTSESDDPELADLRRWVERVGGEVEMRHSLINGLTVTVPAGRVRHLAARPDVTHVSPNRPTRSPASMLEKVSGALGSNGRSSSTKTSYAGLDGSGVGIAIIDSRINVKHDAFTNGNSSRVVKSVQMLSSSTSWSTGSSAVIPEPNSAMWNFWDSAVANTASVIDGYGHGTHVAAVAAGSGKKLAAGTPDINGIAPNANLFDVKVIANNGTGTVADAIEGIQWVVHNARANGIKVINLSIAADSTDSWRVDPPCAAVRQAVASGITVVVAAGNYGRDA